MAKFGINWLEDSSDEAVLEEIRRVAALDPDHRLTVERFDSLAKIKSTTVRKRLGSWSEASRKAGLTHALPSYSDDAIIEDLRRVSERSPTDQFTVAFYSTCGRYSASCIKRRFGGWREALDAAGIGSRFVGPQITEKMRSQPGRAIGDDKILARIREVSARLGKTSLSAADVEANSEVTQYLMHSRFGSVSAALRKAGVEQVSHGRRYTEDEVFENLLKVWSHYGRPPTVAEMDRPPSSVGKNTYLHRYGGWRKALKGFVARANAEANIDAGIVPNGEPNDPPALGRAADATATKGPGPTARADDMRARRVWRRQTDNIPPQDRRDPSIGLRFKVLQRDRFKCALCGDHPAVNAECVLHVDHIIPWSKGGKTQEDNLRTLCASWTPPKTRALRWR
jgi:hypothetical protein